MFVKAKMAGVATPGAAAVTLYLPAVKFAVSGFDVATPDASVTAVFPPVKVARAPLGGTVNVTVTLLTGLLAASRTVATSRFANAVFTVADCGVPLVATIEAAVPGVFVKAKVAGVATPATVA